jgi:hypothetical protein
MEFYRLATASGALAAMLAASVSLADTIEWTNPTNGLFETAANWNVVPPDTGMPPPGVGDTAVFNEAGTYIVTFTQDEASDQFSVTAGDVSFLSDTTTQRLFDLSTGTTDTLVRDGGTLNIGSDANPMFVNVGAQMQIGTGTGDGEVTVSGAQSRLDVLGAGISHVGSSGHVGNLNISNSATANFATNGTLRIGNSGISTTEGAVLVDTGGTLNTGHVEIGTVDSDAMATMTVTGSGSSINQTLAGAELRIGSTSGTTKTLEVATGGVFNSGTGAIDVNKTGLLNIAGGTFNANGDVTIDGGTISVSGQLSTNHPFQVTNAGRLELAAGTVTAGGGLTIDATSTLAGSGTINGNLLSGGTLAPGASAGAINVGGAVTLQSGGLFAAQVGGTVSGTDYDQVTATGMATLGGDLQVSFINSFLDTIQHGDTFEILTSGFGLSGDFANVAQFGRIDTQGGEGSFKVNYGAGSAFDPDRVVLSNFFLEAVSATWNGSTGNWTDAARWSTNPIVPNNNGIHVYNAHINGGTVTLDQPIEVADFTLSRGVIDGTNSLTAHGLTTLGTTGSADITGVSSGSSFFHANGGVLIGVVGVTIERRTFDFQGTFDWADGDLGLQQSVLNIASGQTLLARAAGHFLNGFFSNTLNNDGTIVVDTTSTVTLGRRNNADLFNFSNRGEVHVQQGTLILSSNVSSHVGATVTVEPGAAMLFQVGTHTFDAASTLTVDHLQAQGNTLNMGGTLMTNNISVTGGTANFTGVIPATIDSLQVSGSGTANFSQPSGSITFGAASIGGGELQGSSQFTVTGLTTLSGGTIVGAGAGTSFFHANGGVLMNDGDANIDQRTFDFQGTFDWADGDLGLSLGSVLNIPSGQTLLARAAGHTLRGSFNNTLNNHGTFVVDTTSTITVQSNPSFLFTFNNPGHVRVENGTFRADASTAAVTQRAGTTLTGGTWEVFDGAVLDFAGGSNITTNQGTVILRGPSSTFARINTLADNQGRFEIHEGRNFTTVGDLANSGQVVVGAGSTLTMGGTYTQTGAASSLQVDGQFNSPSGPAMLADGAVLSGSGTIGGEMVIGTDGIVTPGSSPGTLTVENFTFDGGVYEWELDAAGQSDLIVVLDTLTFGSAATLQLIDLGGVPNPMNEYVLFEYAPTAADPINPAWTIDNTQAPTWNIAGVNVVVDDANDRVVLIGLAPVLAGDFNLNGTVDAADYTVWRDHLGAADESALNGNGDGMNGVDQDDYELWKSNFGSTFGTAAGAASGLHPVPEPGTLVLILLTATISAPRSRRRAASIDRL